MTRNHEVVETGAVIIVLLLVALASALDLWADLSHGADLAHVVKEAVVLLLAAGVGIRLFVGLRRQRREITALQAALRESREQADRASAWVREARQHLAAAVLRQFEEWRLTESEQAIGWLLLKGFSLKEIALLRETQEKTVRQQASSIYQKAGLPGRHAFAGWFIEEMLVPPVPGVSSGD